MALITRGGVVGGDAGDVGTTMVGAVPGLPRLAAVGTAGDLRHADLTDRESFYIAVAKPVIDLLVAVGLLVLLAPILMVVGTAVRISLGKGAIYRQQRVGRGGRRFTMYKFRTMQPDRRSAQTPYDGIDRRTCHKRDDDPRHTTVGRFLRRSRLDELPQLWNVIKGDMSLVGPRPELPQIVERYDAWQHERHQVKPGLTGFWQVSDRSGELACDGVDLDIDYLRQRSFLTDFGVLFRTVPVALRRTGH